jgi:hypothetical protein
MPLSREPFFLKNGEWRSGSEGYLEHWYLVLGGVAVSRGFEPQSDLELSFAEILIQLLILSEPSPEALSKDNTWL